MARTRFTMKCRLWIEARRSAEQSRRRGRGGAGSRGEARAGVAGAVGLDRAVVAGVARGLDVAAARRRCRARRGGRGGSARRSRRGRCRARRSRRGRPGRRCRAGGAGGRPAAAACVQSRICVHVVLGLAERAADGEAVERQPADERRRSARGARRYAPPWTMPKSAWSARRVARARQRSAQRWVRVQRRARVGLVVERRGAFVEGQDHVGPELLLDARSTARA